MKRIILTILAIILASSVANAAPLQVTNSHINFQMSGDSYFIDDQHGVGDMTPDAVFATLARYYPSNYWRFNNPSRSGGTLNNALTNIVYVNIFPFAGYRSNDYQNVVVYKSTENGSETFLSTWQYFSNFCKAPQTMWQGDGNPVSVTGWASTHNFQNFGLSDFPAAAADGNITTRGQESSGITNAGNTLGAGSWDIYWHVYTPWTNDNQSGANNVGYTTAAPDHPGAGGHGIADIEFYKQLLPDTNVADAVVDWGGTLVSHDHCAITSISRSGNTLTFTRTDERLYPIIGDVPGPDIYGNVITNDWRKGLNIIPADGNAFWFGQRFTGLPGGIYDITIDGVDCGIFSSANLTTGWNMWTNTVGPYQVQAQQNLTDQRILAHVNPVTRIPQTAGDGVGLVAWGSNAGTQWSLGDRGDTLIANLTFMGDRLKTNYDTINLHSQPPAHVFAVTYLGNPGNGTHARMRIRH